MMSDSPNTSRSAAPLLLGVAVLSFVVAALCEVVGAGSAQWLNWVLSALALPLVLGGGAAIGPLLLVTPVTEPSPLKLGLFSSVLSPALIAAVWAAFAFGLEVPVARAWALTFLVTGVLATLGVRRRMSTVRAGRAAGLVCLFGMVAAGLACMVAWSDAGLAARLASSESIVQATLAQALQDGAPLTNPWVDGLPLKLRPTFAAWLVAAAGPGHLLPLFSMGLVMGWCAFVLALGGYLLSAALFREARGSGAGLRDVTAAVAVVLVAAALDGGAWSTHRWLSMAYTLAFLVAAVHAIRRGARPWPGLACLLLGILGLLHPWAAAGLAVAFALAAVLTQRWLLPPLAALALLPAFLLGRLFGGFAHQQSVPYLAPRAVPGSWTELVQASLGERFAPAGSELTSELIAVLVWAPFGLALLSLVFGWRSSIRAGADEATQESAALDRAAARSGAGFVLASVLALVGVAAILPADSRGDAPDLLAAALLVLAVGMGRWIQALPLGKVGPLLAMVLMGWLVVPVWRAQTGRAARTSPFVEEPYGLTVEQDRELEEGLGAALSFLRASSFARDPLAILLREPGALGPVPRDEPVSITPLLSGMPLWGGRAASPGTDQARSFAPARGEPRTDLGDQPSDRRELLNTLFELESKWQPRFTRVLDAARARGHTLVFLVTEADRRATSERGSGPRGVDDVIRRMGAEVIFEEGNVTVYVASATGE
ncbi:MAG: hypothetical protein ACJAQ3_003278 [Planctomycetota bacterium]|jgi:hypothetical protein